MINPLTLKESDPLGKSPNEAGAKLDAGKNRLGLVISGFALALQEVGLVGTFGANKYTANGWQTVPNGIERYTDAMYRHLLKEAAGEHIDPDSEMLHAAQVAWNALARLNLILQARSSRPFDFPQILHKVKPWVTMPISVQYLFPSQYFLL